MFDSYASAMDEQNAKQELGKRLAEARKRAGMVGPEAAKAITDLGYPVGHKALSAWETGKNVPSALVLGLLAQIYRTSADALLGIAPVKAPNSSSDLSGVEGMMVALFRLLPPDGQASIQQELQKRVAPPKIELVRAANGSKT